MYWRKVLKRHSTILSSVCLCGVSMFALASQAQPPEASAPEANAQTLKNIEAIRTSLTNMNTVSQKTVSSGRMADSPEPQIPPGASADPAPQKMMGMMKGMKKKGCMGKMCKMGMSEAGMMGMSPQMTSAETSNGLHQPDTPHLYHIGETDFFLDYAETIGLNSQQMTTLGQIKHRWENEQQMQVKKRQALEQQLWRLTGADNPELAQIRQTIQQIEQLNSDLRLTFIFRVSDASAVLTGSQKEQLKQHALHTGSPQK